MDLRRERWAVIWEGTVATERTVERLSEHGVKIQDQPVIAHNVGAELARYIVAIHNATLKSNA